MSVKPDRVINRPLKGTLIKFFPDCIIKDLSVKSRFPQFSRKEQTRRLTNEIAAYKRFNELKCHFVPKFLDFSIEQRWFAISRIHGKNLLELLETKQCCQSIRSLLRQIDKMNHWLKRNKFGNMGNCLKDLVLDPSGKLYLVDFESYSPNLQDNKSNADIYETIIYDILERILIRSVRKVQLTSQFLCFSINTFLKRPLKTVELAARCLKYERKNAWWHV